MKRLAWNRRFLVFCINTLILRVAFLVGQTETDVCGERDPRCRITFENAFKLYPNLREFRTPELINLFGYPVETHTVVTEDGYILTVQRISYSKKSRPSSRKIPVVCMHGGYASSAQWFWQPPERALVFMLVDAGYDVWIGNARGTSYSQGHVTLPVDDPSDLRYWDFSTHEYALYDDPAVINYITNHTGHRRIYWVGHSIGAAQILMALSLRPELNSKIRTVFAMAPAAYSGNVTNPIFVAASPFYSQYPIDRLLNWFGSGLTIPKFIANLLVPLTNTCRSSWVDCSLCGSAVYLVLGYSCQLNFTTLPGLLAHFPDVTSVKAISHYSQWVQSGLFNEYDYGRRLNERIYGRPTPPDYQWSNIKVPVLIYHSLGDNLVVPKDAEKTGAALGQNLKEINLVSYPEFTHGDFIIGKDADKFVYNKIIDVMNNRKYDR